MSLQRSIEVDGFTVVNTGSTTQLEQALVAIFLFTLKRARQFEDDDYWGCYEDIQIGNLGANIASIVLGVDICEDDYWVSLCIKATEHEIAKYVIEALLEKVYIEKSEKL